MGDLSKDEGNKIYSCDHLEKEHFSQKRQLGEKALSRRVPGFPKEKQGG